MNIKEREKKINEFLAANNIDGYFINSYQSGEGAGDCTYVDIEKDNVEKDLDWSDVQARLTDIFKDDITDWPIEILHGTHSVIIKFFM